MGPYDTIDTISHKMSLPKRCECGGWKTILKCNCGDYAMGWALDENFQIVYQCNKCACYPPLFKFGKRFYCELFNKCRYIHDRTRELRKECDLCGKLLWDIDEANEYIYDKNRYSTKPNIIGVRYVHNVKTREDLDLCIPCCVKHSDSETVVTKKYYHINFGENKNIYLADMERKCKNFEFEISRLKKVIEERAKNLELIELDLTGINRIDAIVLNIGLTELDATDTKRIDDPALNMDH